MSAEVPGEELPELQIQSDDIPELNQTIDVFDKAREAFLRACTEHAMCPAQETSEKVGQHGADVIYSFQNSVQLIVRNFDNDERIEAITSLMVHEDAERIGIFKELTDSKKLLFLKREQLEDVLRGFSISAEGADDFVEKVVGRFSYHLQKDVGIFAKKAYKRHLQRNSNVYTITLADNDLPESEPSEDAAYSRSFSFSIQPPIHLHDPNFMGDEVSFTFSNQRATYGTMQARIGGIDTSSDADPEEIENIVQEYVLDKFNDAINPLGQAAVSLVWFSQA